MAERFGRYWLHDKIGHGGMAEVYRATVGDDPQRHAFVLALKRLHPQLHKDPKQREMFLTEADVARLLRHPNVLRVYESGTVDAQAYIAMEFVHGTDLAHFQAALRRKRLRFPSDLAVYVAMQVLRALDYVHGAKTSAGRPMEIVHRDVTPANVYLTFGGEVKLGDFGVARVSFLEAPEDESVLKGKLRYMSPEVLMGYPTEQTADLWGVAATLYEMLTGQAPYDVPDEDLLGGAFKPKIEPVHKLNPDVEPALSKILMQALSPKERKRPQTAAQFYRQLKRYLVDQGIQIDKPALSRFVSSVAGTSAPSVQPHGSGAADDAFSPPTYQVPIEVTPTQRIQLASVAGLRQNPVVWGSGLLVVGLVALWAAINMSQPKPDHAPAPPDQATPVASTPEPVAPAPTRAPEAPVEATPDAEVDADPDDEARDDPSPGVLGDPEARFKALMHRGRVALKRKRYPAARQAFEEALTLRPRNLVATLNLAQTRLASDEYDEAEKLVRAALIMDVENPRAHLLLGDILWAKGDDAGAKAAYQRCAQLDPNGALGRTAKKTLQEL